MPLTLVEGVEGFVVRVVDDAKIDGGAGRSEKARALQKDLDRNDRWDTA